MIIKLQSLKGKTKLKLLKNNSAFYGQMNYMGQSNAFQFEDDP